MKRVKFVGILIFAVWLAGCTQEASEPPSKTTSVDEIVLRAYHYPEEAQDFWAGGWESSLQDKNLLLSNLLPGGQIKNNTKYEVTITAELEFLTITNTKVSGKVYDKMQAFQYVFTKPGIDPFARWTDLVAAPSEPIPVTGGAFFVRGTLTTNPDAADYFQDSALALTNAFDTDAPVPEEDQGEDVAKFTDVVITITER